MTWQEKIPKSDMPFMNIGCVEWQYRPPVLSYEPCSFRLERATVNSFRILRDQVGSPVIPKTEVQLCALGIGVPLDPRRDRHFVDHFSLVDTREVYLTCTSELMIRDHVYCLH